jgi:exopolyphosphatase / guanosine-5'-triphosphate,3'-diphosphate pyrophosphatase
MRIGIIDVGSNTVRLLIAERCTQGAVRSLQEERDVLGLGAEIERLGRISSGKLREAGHSARRCAMLARSAGCDVVEVVVTAPGRQSRNADRLVTVLERAAEAPVRVLSAHEEGRLAYLGAVARADGLAGRVAVCDIGGGSTELAVGVVGQPPWWLESFETGSLRLTRRFLHDRPTRKALAAAREHVRTLVASADPPAADVALATGGAARAIRKLAGRRLGEAELAEVIGLSARLGLRGLVRRHRVEPARAATVTAGAIILSEVQALLGLPLVVARGGLREGLAHVLLPQTIAA